MDGTRTRGRLPARGAPWSPRPRGGGGDSLGQVSFDFGGHDPGGRLLPIPAGVTVDAVFGGPDDRYRYWLEWCWDTGASQRTLVVGMMNPSGASHRNSDSTVSWVHRWAVRNGFGRMVVVNASAYRCRDQARLAEVDDPCGPDNHAHFARAAEVADLIVVGYGQPRVRAVRNHGPEMVRALRGSGKAVHAWALSKDGTPKHPLYLPADVVAVPLPDGLR